MENGAQVRNILQKVTNRRAVGGSDSNDRGRANNYVDLHHVKGSHHAALLYHGRAWVLCEPDLCLL